jgi:hypothetical protein
MASGQFGEEIKAETHLQVRLDEQFWRENGFNVETGKLHAQLFLSFLNHLAEAGVLQKAPDTFWYECSPQPECKEHNKWFNFSVITSRDVEDFSKGMFISNENLEYIRIVLAKPSNPTVTGITQEGNNATVEFTYGYSPTPLYARIAQLTKDDFAKCSIPEIASEKPLFCPGSNSSWPSENDIAAKKGTGSLQFKKYDDGWRIVKEEQ